MATLVELRELATGADGATLRIKIVSAITIKANAVVNAATPTAEALAWASAALARPEQYEQLVLNVALADAVPAATKEQIAAATDLKVQTVVDNVVDKLLAV